MASSGTVPNWQDTDAGRRIQARLADEHTLAVFDHLLARIDALETTVTRMVALMEQAPVHFAMLADISDELYRKADEKGIRIEERVAVGLRIAEQLTSSEMGDRVETAFKFLDQMPGLAAMTVDTLDNAMRDAMDQGLDPQAIGGALLSAGTALSAAAQEAPAPVGGPLALLRSLRDPDRQKALGFLMSFLKQWGRRL
jgi:uncharacterized protein YjgD (DUF1641 family)